MTPVRGKKSEQTSEEIRASIMASARKHFAMHGFQGASLKDVAGEAGVANSLINYHFGDKEGLFHACMEPFARGRMEAILRILGEPRSRDEIRVRIEIFVEEMMVSFINDPYSFEIVDREIRAGSPVILKIFESTMLLAFKAVVEFFARAKENDLLKAEADPLISSIILFTSCCDAVRKDVLGQKFLGVSFRDASFRKKYAEHVVQMFTSWVLK